jgi:hypothetical protein
LKISWADRGAGTKSAPSGFMIKTHRERIKCVVTHFT